MVRRLGRLRTGMVAQLAARGKEGNGSETVLGEGRLMSGKGAKPS